MSEKPIEDSLMKLLYLGVQNASIIMDNASKELEPNPVVGLHGICAVPCSHSVLFIDSPNQRNTIRASRCYVVRPLT